MGSHAEVERVWPRDGRIRITGRLHHHRPAGSGRGHLLLKLRGHAAHRLRYDATLDGDGFDVSLPVDDLALDGLARATWDLHLAFGPVEDPELLRLGRHLDDIEGKRKIYVFPAQSVPGDEDGTVVRPVYTKNDDLSVECVPGDIELHPYELPVERQGWAGR